MNSTATTALQESEPFTPEDQFVIFSLDGNDFALPVGTVDRIVRAVNITGVPGAKENLLGVINLHGQAIPVFNIRKIFNLPLRGVKLSDLFLLVRISGRSVSIIADSVKGITKRKDQKIIPAGKIFPGMEKILEGLVFFEDGTVLIYDPEKLFSVQDLSKIDMNMVGQKITEIHDKGNEILQKSREDDKTGIKKKGLQSKTEKQRGRKKIEAKKRT
jgi:purine-binding chemotaxis protein CheW